MKKILLSILLLPGTLYAQIPDSDSLNWKADLALSGLYQAGNVETKIFRANSNFSFKPYKNWVFETKNSYIYQEFGQDKADEDILSLNFLNFNPYRPFYPLILGFVSTNFRREIDLRYLVGAGFSYQILKEEKNFLKLSVTTEYEHTEFKEDNFNRSKFNGSTIINTWRATLWVSGNYDLIADKLVISHESYFQPSLEESSNYRWQADTSIEFPIWKYLSITMSYLYTYENIVIDKQKPEDRILSIGLKIKSY